MSHVLGAGRVRESSTGLGRSWVQLGPLKGEGITIGKSTGDLFVTVKITVPENIDEKQRAALEDLSNLFGDN